MYPTYGSNFKPLRYKSFLGEPDPQEVREQQELAELKAKLEAAAVTAPPPPPTYSEAELDAACKRAFEEGRALGMKDERALLNKESADREAALHQAFLALGSQLAQISQEQQSFLLQQREVLSALAMTVARKVAGRALIENPLIEIEDMIGTALQQLGSTQPLEVNVHPAILRYMESIYAEKAVLMPAGSFKLSFRADESLAQLDDCRIRWANGCMSRNQADIWAQIETILQAFDPHTAYAAANAPASSSEDSLYQPGAQDAYPSQE